MKNKFRFIFLSLALGTSIQVAQADILGAAVGGLIGSQFGQGDGKLAMTAIGAVIGDRVTEQNYRAPNPSHYSYQPDPYDQRYSGSAYQAPVRINVYPSQPHYVNRGYAPNFPPGRARGWYGHPPHNPMHAPNPYRYSYRY